MSSDEDLGILPPKRKKGCRNTCNYVKEKRKVARMKGEEYVNSVGNTVPAKKTGSDCKCKYKCCGQFSQEDKDNFIVSLYTKRTKTEQDTSLMGNIERFDVQRPKAGDDSKKKKKSSFKYFVLRGTERMSVCREAFLSLYAVSNKSVFRLTTLLSKNETPTETRGKHNNRGNLLPPDATAKIDSHIQEYPTKIARYTGKSVTYLDSTLITVKKMHEMFQEKYPQLKDVVKYEYYLKHSKSNYGYWFGRPQVDVCSTCEELNIKIKSPFLNETAKRCAVAELIVHKRRSSKFYKKFEEIKNLGIDTPNVTGLAFDYMQNLALPFIPVQEMFYLL